METKLAEQLAIMHWLLQQQQQQIDELSAQIAKQEKRLLGSVGPPIPEELTTPSAAEPGRDGAEVLPPVYSEFEDVFSKVETDTTTPITPTTTTTTINPTKATLRKVGGKGQKGTKRGPEWGPEGGEMSCPVRLGRILGVVVVDPGG